MTACTVCCTVHVSKICSANKHVEVDTRFHLEDFVESFDDGVRIGVRMRLTPVIQPTSVELAVY